MHYYGRRAFRCNVRLATPTQVWEEVGDMDWQGLHFPMKGLHFPLKRHWSEFVKRLFLLALHRRAQISTFFIIYLFDQAVVFFIKHQRRKPTMRGLRRPPRLTAMTSIRICACGWTMSKIAIQTSFGSISVQQHAWNPKLSLVGHSQYLRRRHTTLVPCCRQQKGSDKPATPA